jgi:drug/metabolite transporter (DMT)-like permease
MLEIGTALAAVTMVTAALTYFILSRDQPDFLAWFVVVGFFGIIVLLTVKPLPQGANEAVLILVGQASAGFGAIIGYRYGTTQGSARKDQTIVTLAAASTPPQPVDSPAKPG